MQGKYTWFRIMYFFLLNRMLHHLKFCKILVTELSQVIIDCLSYINYIKYEEGKKFKKILFILIFLYSFAVSISQILLSFLFYLPFVNIIDYTDNFESIIYPGLLDNFYYHVTHINHSQVESF